MVALNRFVSNLFINSNIEKDKKQDRSWQGIKI